MEKYFRISMALELIESLVKKSVPIINWHNLDTKNTIYHKIGGGQGSVYIVCRDDAIHIEIQIARNVDKNVITLFLYTRLFMFVYAEKFKPLSASPVTHATAERCSITSFFQLTAL
jgi:hypothetical protein